MKKLIEKYSLVIKYLVFGISTTVVSWVTYFTVLYSGRALLSLPSADTSSGKYIAVYTAAQVIQWIASVIFAFFTNRKWVFTDYDRETPTAKQFGVFAGGRVLTFFVDYGVTLLGAVLLAKLIPSLNSVALLGKYRNINEIIAKLIAAVLVIIGNYFFSKIFVFKSHMGGENKKSEK